jgi:HAD superfamily hydrolase (TIGR01509 family)
LAHLITELTTINQQYILSNLDESTYQELVAQYPDIFRLFNGAMISAEVGIMKPDLEIYKLLLSKYDIAPETCVFLDDQRENIETAKTLGIKSILYTRVPALKNELRKFNVPI